MTDHDTIKPPGYLSLAAESRAVFALPALLLRAPGLRNAPRGDGRRVILLPGYLAGDFSMAPLAAYLRFLGYRARSWGMGRNKGDVEALVFAFGASLADLVRDDGAPASLVGWSLGGVIARETAREYPDLVRDVVTLGSPIKGGPKYTSVAPIYASRFGVDLDAFENDVHERNQRGLSQPVTSIYSKADGVVAWRASIDDYNAHARNVEVQASHFSMGVHAQTWRVVAEALAHAQTQDRAERDDNY